MDQLLKEPRYIGRKYQIPFLSFSAYETYLTFHNIHIPCHNLMYNPNIINSSNMCRAIPRKETNHCYD